MKTLTVDAHKRIRIPDAKPRTVFAYENHGDGKITLTVVEAARPPKAKLVRERGHTYLLSDRQVSNEDVQRVMESFP